MENENPDMMAAVEGADAGAMAAVDPEKQKLMENKEETMEDKKKGLGFGGDDSEGEYESQVRNEKLSNCCCCLCVCENDVTAGYTCCCCFPIKCGIMVIGCLTIGLCFYYISWNFFLILNDQVAWWFPCVTIILLIPLYLASAFFVNWFIKDDMSTRRNLNAAIMLVLISIGLCTLWNIIYYVWIYKREDVFIGYGIPEEKYQKFQKKYYLFKVLLESAILLALYSYFQCVVSSYMDILRKEKKSEA